ncbi:MAG: hypothetical protein RLZZ142_2414 [Verrucomicrobiota bacterium]
MSGSNPSNPASRARILVIRGGALGDFVLTLPALGLLREAFPDAWIELLGYPHIAVLAKGRYYVDALKSIEYGPMAGFFARNGTLDPGLSEYFAGFQQVISCLYDPDGIFEANLRRAGVKHFLAAYRKPASRHAAREWAEPLEKLALFLEHPEARIFLTPDDRVEARHWLGHNVGVRLAIHPGSGSPRKNWPLEGWVEVARRFLAKFPQGELVLVGGEADGSAVERLEGALCSDRVRRAENLPLPLLAGVLAECGFFAGHDSGVSHVASAVGARCALLFGPTDPAIWAPLNPGVSVLQAPEGDWSRLMPSAVWRHVERLFLDRE